ncbi:preprotein translocase subunit SecG [Candidatus Peregrinibacteria bacterium]|nr:preprotein translocase subunit SecG [Candidatus Peregrinibacteria bacterium]MBI3816657.1 preprotein translocase subunit SecG [Candidatus Peregrinibacteria bacterium]
MPILTFLLIAISLLLSLLILLQHRASGLTATFGGSGATFVQRRGAEKVIYKLSIWLSVIFFAMTIVQLYFSA